MKQMASLSGTSTSTLFENLCWQADKRLLPQHLRTSDNARSILHYKIALRNAMQTQITEKEQEYLRLCYDQQMTKTQISKIYGVGSSAVCKTIKAAQEKIRAYVELYMQIYSMLEQERLNEEEEMYEVCGGQINYAKYRVNG